MESGEKIFVKANQINVLDGVQVVVERGKSSRLEILVDDHGDEYDTKMEVRDRIWLGDTRWLVEEILETSETFVEQWSGTKDLAVLSKLDDVWGATELPEGVETLTRADLEKLAEVPEGEFKRQTAERPTILNDTPEERKARLAYLDRLEELSPDPVLQARIDKFRKELGENPV